MKPIEQGLCRYLPDMGALQRESLPARQWQVMMLLIKNLSRAAVTTCRAGHEGQGRVGQSRAGHEGQGMKGRAGHEGQGILI